MIVCRNEVDSMFIEDCRKFTRFSTHRDSTSCGEAKLSMATHQSTQRTIPMVWSPAPKTDNTKTKADDILVRIVRSHTWQTIYQAELRTKLIWMGADWNERCTVENQPENCKLDVTAASVSEYIAVSSRHSLSTHIAKTTLFTT